MATLNQVRTKVDDWLADKWPTVVARQETYFSNHGRYWQGLRTHTFTPAFTNSTDGDSSPDSLVEKPTDVAQSWLDILPEWDSVAIPCAMQINVYESPSGHGFVAQVWVTYNGTTYTRKRNFGPLTELTEGWSVYTP